MPRQPPPRPPAAPAPGFCRPARRLRAVAGLAAAGMVLAAGGCSSPAGRASTAAPAGTVVPDCLTQVASRLPRGRGCGCRRHVLGTLSCCAWRDLRIGATSH